MRRVIDEVRLTSARKLGRSWSKLRGEVRGTDNDRTIAIYLLIGAITIGALDGWGIGLIVLVMWVMMLCKR